MIRPEMAIAPEQLLEQLEGSMLFIGDGALRYRELIIERLGSCAQFAEEHLNYPKASAGAALALSRLRSGETVSPVELLPRYLRLSEAELNKR